MDIFSGQGIATPSSAWLPAVVVDSLPRHFSSLFAAAVFILLISVSFRPTQTPTPKSAPALPETIPYISNMYQYMTNMSKLLSRARYFHFLVPFFSLSLMFPEPLFVPPMLSAYILVLATSIFSPNPTTSKPSFVRPLPSTPPCLCF